MTFKDVHLTCMRVLAEGLSELGLLPVSVDEAMDESSTVYRRWTLHGFGHMLGIDVHDCLDARQEMYKDGTLGEGYVLTVEPGLYFQPEDDLVPEELRGIGIRIEDDVLVTAAGAVNLSAGLPRTADEVEAWLAAQREAGPGCPETSDRSGKHDQQGSSMTLDVDRARRETPGCTNVVHLNNAGAALPPAVVTDAVIEHLRLEAQMGGYEAAAAAAASVNTSTTRSPV